MRQFVHLAASWLQTHTHTQRTTLTAACLRRQSGGSNAGESITGHIMAVGEGIVIYRRCYLSEETAVWVRKLSLVIWSVYPRGK